MREEIPGYEYGDWNWSNISMADVRRAVLESEWNGSKWVGSSHEDRSRFLANVTGMNSVYDEDVPAVEGPLGRIELYS